MNKVEMQREAIDRVEHASTDAARVGDGSVLRLVFVPAVVLFRGLFLKGQLFRGVDGLKGAVNEWALAFLTESKRYEKSYADDSEQKLRCRDFS